MSPKVRIIHFNESIHIDEGLVISLTQTLKSVPLDYLRGLDSVVLRDTKALTTKERRSRVGRESTPLDHAKGTYCHSHGGRKAYIELFIDNIMIGWPPWAERLPILRNEIVNEIFFHELAHHLQAIYEPLRPQSERRAREVGRRLFQGSFRQRHPMLVPVVFLLRLIVRFAIEIRDRLSRSKAVTGASKDATKPS